MLRRVFGESPQQAHRLVCLLLLTGGWRGVVSVLDVVPAGQHHEAPWLDVAGDLLPPPRPPMASSWPSMPDRPYLGHAAGLPEATRDEATSKEPASVPFVPPEACQRPREASRGHADGLSCQPRIPRSTREHAQTRKNTQARRAWLAEVCCPLAEAACGWYVDRRRAGLDTSQHRDPLPSAAGWPADLAFGPDRLATDDDDSECDPDAAITHGTQAERAWHQRLRW